jgi:putative tryptophan/tyrosine transport system substrate-binding protein
MPGENTNITEAIKSKARPLGRWYIRSRDQGQTRAGSPNAALGTYQERMTADRLGDPASLLQQLPERPANAPTAKATLWQVAEAARVIGLQIHVLNAKTSSEIEAAFAALVRDRADALYVAADQFFGTRRVQFATLAMRHVIPAAFVNREFPEVGVLMSYGTDIADRFRQVGIMSGQILKGAKPADLPVMQSTKFEFVINLQTARALGVEVPPQLLASVDEVIE